MATTVWKGFLSFGLLSIPVRLYSAARSERISLNPLYFDASYYMTPEPEGKKAYFLLQNALQDSNYSAIAKLTMHQREHTVIIRPHKSNGKNGLTLHTMYYQSEIREVAEYGGNDKVEVNSAEKKLGAQFIEHLAATFQPE